MERVNINGTVLTDEAIKTIATLQNNDNSDIDDFRWDVDCMTCRLYDMARFDLEEEDATVVRKSIDLMRALMAHIETLKK